MSRTHVALISLVLIVFVWVVAPPRPRPSPSRKSVVSANTSWSSPRDRCG